MEWKNISLSLKVYAIAPQHALPFLSQKQKPAVHIKHVQKNNKAIKGHSVHVNETLHHFSHAPQSRKTDCLARWNGKVISPRGDKSSDLARKLIWRPTFGKWSLKAPYSLIKAQQ